LIGSQVETNKTADPIAEQITLLQKEKGTYIPGEVAARQFQSPADAIIVEVNLPKAPAPGSYEEARLIAEYDARLADEEAELRLDKALKDLDLTEMGNADRLVRRYSDKIRFCHAFNAWMIWSGDRWQRDESSRIIGIVKRMTRRLIKEADQETNDTRRAEMLKHAARSQKHSVIRASIELSKDLVPIAPRDLDTDSRLFNLKNGTINIATMQFREHRKDDFISKIAGTRYDPAAKCPTWIDHLNLIFCDDTKFISSFQQMAGYCLLGNNPEQILFVLYGTGKNGKSVTVDVLRTIWGDYAATVAPETLMTKRFDEGPRSDIARLVGARMVTSTEGEGGSRLAESLIKQLTGGDIVTVRRLYETEFEFKPVCKILLATNHLPTIRGTDHAIWRRIWAVPFNVTIPEKRRDNGIITKLLSEAPGIFNWCLDGLMLYYENGSRLTRPDRVAEATEAYRTESDLIGAFIADCCVLGQNEEESRAGLRNMYETWCDDNGEKPVNPNTFARLLRERGVVDGKTLHGSRRWRGIRLKTVNERDAAERGTT
jgi:putative DNA primase/helicase